MLPDDVLRLVTAAVDGELTPAEEARARRLLDRSPEAYTLFRRLQADRARVRALPITPPPAGLHDRIMAALPPAPVPCAAPGASPAARKPDRRPVWVGLAAAVAVAAGVGVFLANRPVNRPDQVAHQTPPPKSPRPVRVGEPRPVPAVVDPRPPEPVPGPGQGGTVAAAPPPGPAAIEVAPRPVERDLSAFPPLAPPGGFDLARPWVPPLVAAADLGRDDVRQRLADALARDPAVRVELFSKDPARAVELFQAAAKAAGLTVHADAVTGERLKRRQQVVYLAYTEGLTPARIGDLLARMVEADAAAPPRVLAALHLPPVGPADARELKDVLGVDVGLPGRRPAAGPPAPADPMPLSAGTADQLAKNLTAKDGDRPAVLVTLGPSAARTSPASAEVRQFLARRGDRNPGTVQLLFVVRPSNG
jgi:hypothetical protein